MAGINNNMQKNNVKTAKKDGKVQQTPTQKEQYGIHFSSSLKITDPNTGKVILRMRCD